MMLTLRELDATLRAPALSAPPVPAPHEHHRWRGSQVVYADSQPPIYLTTPSDGLTAEEIAWLRSHIKKAQGLGAPPSVGQLMSAFQTQNRAARSAALKGDMTSAQNLYLSAISIVAQIPDWQHTGFDQDLEITRLAISGDPDALEAVRSGGELLARGKINARPDSALLAALNGLPHDIYEGAAGLWSGTEKALAGVGVVLALGSTAYLVARFWPRGRRR